MAASAELMDEISLQLDPIKIDELKMLGLDELRQITKILQRRNLMVTQETRMKFQFNPKPKPRFRIAAHELVRFSTSVVQHSHFTLFVHGDDSFRTVRGV